MKFSYFIPNMQEGRRAPVGSIDSEGMFQRARAAEDLGYDGLWIGEYIETPPDVRSGFPDEPANEYAPIATMAALAAITKRVRITSAVVVLPYHDPLILGREVATLDQFSNGRITLGIGLGGSVDEFRKTKLLVTSINRSKVMEECIEAMRALWTQPRASYQGEHFAFSEVESFPKPVQRHLPIPMAGTAEAVLQRIGRMGDGWIEVIYDPAQMRTRIERLRGYLAEAGRADQPIEISRVFAGSIAETDEEAEATRAAAITYKAQVRRRNPIEGEGKERFFVGSVDFHRRRLEAYAEAGVTEACVSFFEPDVASSLRQLELFARKVIPDFR